MHDKSYPPMTSYYTVNVDASEVVDNQVVQSGTISFYSKLTGTCLRFRYLILSYYITLLSPRPFSFRQEIVD